MKAQAPKPSPGKLQWHAGQRRTVTQIPQYRQGH